MLGSDLLTTEGMKWYHKLWFYPFLIIGTVIVGLWSLAFIPIKAIWALTSKLK